jgi:hypothetical protein
MPQGLSIVKSEPLPQVPLAPMEPVASHQQPLSIVKSEPLGAQVDFLDPLGINRFATDAVIGAGKGLLQTIRGGGQLIRNAIPALNHGPEVNPPINIETTNTAQSVGKGAERVAEFMAPAGILGKAKAALKTGSAILDTLIGAGLEGGSAAAVSSAQKGSTEGAATTGLIAGGSSVALQGLFKAVGAMSQKAETALVKPSAADIRDGFKADTIFKYKLGGSLGQTFEKTDARLKDLGQQLRTALQSEPTAKVDIYRAYSDAADELAKDAAKNFGQNAAIQKALTKMGDEIDIAIGKSSGGLADVLTANELKQATGKLGAWYHAPGGPASVDPDAAAMERVANTFYAKLKDSINAAIPGGRINAINREISELIPIQRAVLRRLPVEARSNVIGLGDMLSVVRGDGLGLALGAANRLSKSGAAIGAGFKAGQNAPELSAGMARILAALQSQTVPAHEVKR